MRNYPSLIGNRYGKLLVVEQLASSASGQRRWLCKCDCGGTCAAIYAASKARESAGFIEGTQLSKIRDMTPSAANTSGYRGIYYESRFDRWRVEIRFQNKRYYLGVYKNKDDAIKARRKAEEDLYETFLERMESQGE